MNEAVSITANLLGDPGRAAMLLSLMGGVSRPAGELAQLANVAPPTASAHLAKLVDGRLLTVERQGRHRYYRLADGDVADAIESLLVLTGRSQSSVISADPAKAPAGSLAYARTCYAHLAGWLGVRIAESLEERGLIAQIDPKTYGVTPAGRDWFAALDIEIASAKPDRPLRSRRCLDWTERRHHLAGALGCGLYRRLNELKWTAPLRNTRAIRVTVEGKVRLWELLRIPIG
jgi:DNA-binding transcriptional ArsR family regulator